MFDIVRCHADAAALGFTRVYSIEEARPKLAEADNLSAVAEKLKNRKIIVLLKDHAMDDGAMRVIGEKGNVCFLIDLGGLMKLRGVPRAIAISKLRNFLAQCVKYNAFYAFATFAESENQLRTPAEMEHIAMLLGVNRGQAKFALKMIGGYL